MKSYSDSVAAWLLIQGVPAALWNAPVRSTRVMIGRAKYCSVRIPLETVSRRHAEVWHRAGTMFIRDLKSRNGTFIDGRRIAESSFRVGNVIQLGSVELISVSSLDTDEDAELETEVYSRKPADAPDPADQLSPAQSLVLKLLLQGISEKEVAQTLGLSPHTVHTHAKRIYKELGVQSRAQLLVKYLTRMQSNQSAMQSSPQESRPDPGTPTDLPQAPKS